MRRLRHLILGLLALVIVAVVALAFALYDPLASGPYRLKLSQLITAPIGQLDITSPLEPPVGRTEPAWLAALALRYQPTVVVAGDDRFWPVSLSTLLGETWNGRPACLYHHDVCTVRAPTVLSLAHGGSREDYLRLPSPLDDVSQSFAAFLSHLGLPRADWPNHLPSLDPFASAQIYFYYLPHPPAHAYPGAPKGLAALEYWFLYPLNYFPLVRVPLQALSSPIASTIGNTDYHQGDLEHVAVLIDPTTHQPRYLWMARHADEGAAYRWHSSQLQWTGEHPWVYEALGSHASYAHCGIQRRSRTYYFINDYVVCIPHQTYGFLPASTPLIDLAHTPWACWPGHLGQAGRGLDTGQVGLAPFEVAGPQSPLQQAENFPGACHVSPTVPAPKAPL